jgi:hypothetical protein
MTCVCERPILPRRQCQHLLTPADGLLLLCPTCVDSTSVCELARQFPWAAGFLGVLTASQLHVHGDQLGALKIISGTKRTALAARELPGAWSLYLDCLAPTRQHTAWQNQIHQRCQDFCTPDFLYFRLPVRVRGGLCVKSLLIHLECEAPRPRLQE